MIPEGLRNERNERGLPSCQEWTPVHIQLSTWKHLYSGIFHKSVSSLQAGTFFKKSLLLGPCGRVDLSQCCWVNTWTSVSPDDGWCGWGTANSVCLLKLHHHLEQPAALQLARGTECRGSATDSPPVSPVCVVSSDREGPEVLRPRLWGGLGVPTQVKADHLATGILWEWLCCYSCYY